MTLSAALARTLRGSVDLHCHSGPSPFPRELDHVEAAADGARVEMRAILVKSHHHSTVMAETQRLVADAEGRAAAAEDRAREATTAANLHSEQAHADADALMSKARREAEQLVSAAKKEADSLRSTGHADAEAELAAIKAEVERMSKRRDGIVAQLGALKDVVKGFGEED